MIQDTNQFNSLVCSFQHKIQMLITINYARHIGFSFHQRSSVKFLNVNLSSATRFSHFQTGNDEVIPHTSFPHSSCLVEFWSLELFTQTVWWITVVGNFASSDILLSGVCAINLKRSLVSGKVKTSKRKRNNFNQFFIFFSSSLKMIISTKFSHN